MTQGKLMDPNEEYVRSVWGNVEFDKHKDIAKLTLPVLWRGAFNTMYETDRISLWSAAAEFTRERLEKIRQVEEEIAWLSDGIDVSGDDEPIGERILAREQAALAELRKGMKDQGRV